MSGFSLRSYRAEDFNFIANSYLKSYRRSPEVRHMLNEVYYPTFTQRLEYMLKTSTILVACSNEDPSHILGYAIVNKDHTWDILHYVYVKYTFRRMGVATELVKHLCPHIGTRMTLVSHLRKNWAEAEAKYKLVFDPQYGRQA